MSDEQRRDKRYPTHQRLLVRCESWAEFAQRYATDVSQGGMFIALADRPEILSEVDVSLLLPEGHEIALCARVVHVLDEATAASENKRAGIGVQFIDLDPIRKQQIRQLVEFARWEGVSENPTSTLASRMFEVSASLPPSRVLEALPASASGPAAPARNTASIPASSTRPGISASRRPGTVAASGRPRAAAEQEPSTSPPKPTDQVKLKLAMTHLAHKRFEQAIKVFEEMVRDNPGDRQTQQWMHIAHARLRLKNGDEAGAAEHYQKALDVGEDNHEARKFVREHSTKKRLNSLPFGRYFVKKP